MSSIKTIKEILSITFKKRNDSYTDQYCRLFMPRLFLVCSLIMGVDFFSDKVSCIVPGSSNLGKDFIHSVCWIQGFYIYTQLKARLDESSYYGIPRDIDKDGVDSAGRLCQRQPRGLSIDDDCKLMDKTFYLQFQWMPFFIASLAIFHYFPYMLFRIVNTDIMSLKMSLQSDTTTSEDIVNNYFNYKINSKVKMKIRSWMNLIVKMCYVIVTIATLHLCNFSLNGDYYDYGVYWMRWMQFNNTHAHDFEKFEYAKPGNVLLPPMGFCEIEEKIKELRYSYINTNKFVCEISPNILYQYVFIILWFFIIFSIAISSIGFCTCLFTNLIAVRVCKPTQTDLHRLYDILEFREKEYLIMIFKERREYFQPVITALKTRYRI